MTNLFTMRPAEIKDLAYLQIICEEQGLGKVESIDFTTVAVNDEDLPIGFIHIEHVGNEGADANGAYVYPVAVLGSWQHHGVATALIRHELEKNGELKLVACRSSQGFYPRLGFEIVDWAHMAKRIARDCDSCAAREECDPIPFWVKLKDSSKVGC